MQGFMYMLRCADDSYYTGSTKDLEVRLAQHQTGEGANHTKNRLPVELVYYERYPRIDMAFEREKQVQGWSRKKKEALINGEYDELPELAKAYRDIPSRTSGNTPSRTSDKTPSASSESGMVSEALEDTPTIDLKAHLLHIKDNPFEFAVNRVGFSEEEVAYIEQYGHWLHALLNRKLKPITPEQLLFIEEMKSRKPIDECLPQVRLWKRYLRKEIERDQGVVINALPPTIADDPFGSREEYRAMRSAQFSTISQTHRA